MKAIVLQDISPIIKKGDILVRKGKVFIKQGENKGTFPTSKKVEDPDTGEEVTEYYNTPNYYAKDLVLKTKKWFKVLR